MTLSTSEEANFIIGQSLRREGGVVVKYSPSPLTLSLRGSQVDPLPDPVCGHTRGVAHEGGTATGSGIPPLPSQRDRVWARRGATAAASASRSARCTAGRGAASRG